MTVRFQVTLFVRFVFRLHFISCAIRVRTLPRRTFLRSKMCSSLWKCYKVGISAFVSLNRGFRLHKLAFSRTVKHAIMMGPLDLSTLWAWLKSFAEYSRVMLRGH